MIDFSRKVMIPKTIHYCWFGGKEKPRSVRKCLLTWKKHLTDYKIIEWNEQNFDVNAFAYTKAAHKHQKYAFVSDYVRLHVLEHYGGIYFDTDVEVLKSFDEFLELPGFIGYESPNCLGTAVMAAEKGNPLIKEFLAYYDTVIFDENHLVANTNIISNIVHAKGIELNNEFAICQNALHLYPLDYFIVKTYYDFKFHLSDNSHSIHHCDATWLPWSLRMKWKLLSRSGSTVHHLYFFLHRLKSGKWK